MQKGHDQATETVSVLDLTARSTAVVTLALEPAQQQIE